MEVGELMIKVERVGTGYYTISDTGVEVGEDSMCETWNDLAKLPPLRMYGFVKNDPDVKLNGLWVQKSAGHWRHCK